eukprot:TRINITY_DN1126_c0_g1_i1.p1 TRINITY_DN1126_c0_g1~~TRINITY_DN1126_c0_g1_i1.p1  ORF type:complete len:119 (-),score=36.61 TRINITY_DN1126_c0_g1_i1:206-562(-)
MSAALKSIGERFLTASESSATPLSKARNQYFGQFLTTFPDRFGAIFADLKSAGNSVKNFDFTLRQATRAGVLGFGMWFFYHLGKVQGGYKAPHLPSTVVSTPWHPHANDSHGHGNKHH